MDFPVATSQRLFDGLVVRMDFGDRKVLNLHMSGSITRKLETEGVSEEQLLRQVENFFTSLLSM